MSEYQSHSHNRNYGCRIVQFILEGFHAVSLENEKVRVTILIDKGTDIYEFLYKPHDVDFLWRSRVGLRPMEHFQPMSPVASGAFLEFYEGGWQEMFPWGGHASEYRGVNTGMHGEVALTPWDFRIDVDTPEEVRITCSVRTRRMPFSCERPLRYTGIGRNCTFSRKYKTRVITNSPSSGDTIRHSAGHSSMTRAFWICPLVASKWAPLWMKPADSSRTRKEFGQKFGFAREG